jgi:hypothetical protein
MTGSAVTAATGGGTLVLLAKPYIAPIMWQRQSEVVVDSEIATVTRVDFSAPLIWQRLVHR